MFTVKKLKSLVLFVALFSGVVVFAQTEQTQPQPQKAQTQTEINDAELQEFATVLNEIMHKSRQAQQQIVGTIKEEGLTMQRYKELSMNQSDAEATTEELAKKKRIDAKIQEMKPKLQKQQMDIIKKSDLSLERYQQIALSLRTDKELQQKVRQILVDKQSSQQ